MMPTERNGSVVIYNRVIRPFVLRHQKQIDSAMSRAVGVAGEIVEEGKQGKEEGSGREGEEGGE